jgi:hypothetical protein
MYTSSQSASLPLTTNAQDFSDINIFNVFNPLNAELNPICHLLAFLGAHPILHVSRIRDKH